MIKFSIFLPTYNRPELVVNTLNSLVGQSYPDFEILLYDNGSRQSIKSIVDTYCDDRINYIRYESNQNTNDIAEDSINRMSGTHFLFLADDDVLLPSALTIVAGLIDKYNIEILQTGFTSFNHNNRIVDIQATEMNRFTGNLEKYNPQEAALHFCNGWGIGRKQTHKAPRMAHSSGIFLAKKLIEKTRMCQRELFIKPFGDIGYVGALLNAENYYYIDLPLAIIGETPIREMNGSKPGQRQKWTKDIKYLEYSPVKGASFVNMGADAHLKVLIRNGWRDRYDCTLQPNFYFRYLRQVVSDNPWTFTTLKDIATSIPHCVISLLYSFFKIHIINYSNKLVRNEIRTSDVLPVVSNEFNSTVTSKILPCAILKFKDINDYAIWIDDHYL